MLLKKRRRNLNLMLRMKKVMIPRIRIPVRIKMTGSILESKR
jgi:hypothetical protein